MRICVCVSMRDNRDRVITSFRKKIGFDYDNDDDDDDYCRWSLSARGDLQHGDPITHMTDAFLVWSLVAINSKWILFENWICFR